MVIKEKNNKITDRAWVNLYKRFEEEGLLSEREMPKQTFFHLKGLRWAASIAILCVCTLSGWLIKQHTGIQKPELLVLHNEKNASTLATILEDGSVVYLSEQTTIHYPDHFQEDKRKIALQGDAFFEIRKQQRRPFYIDTESAEIEVLGTSFNIQSEDKSSFLLSVRNGEVKVTLKKSKQIVYVKAGETALLKSNYLETSKDFIQEFDNYFKRIHFKDECLVNIAHIINLNSNSIQLIIAPELENRLLTVGFSVDDPEIMADLICLALNLKCTQKQNTIFISE